MKQKQVPQIRFKGFEEEWEKTTLRNISSKVTEKNINSKYSETFTNSAEFGIISQRDFFDHDISNEDHLNGYYIIREDDFVYNPRISVTAPVGPINRNKLKRSGVISPLYTVFRTHDTDNTYLELFFKCTLWYKYMRFNGDSGARSDRFSIKNSVFFSMPIPKPSLLEQKKIGDLLINIIIQISLHQSKLEKLKQLKHSMLTKMFPQADSTTPEIRFKGFEEEWEEKELGGCFDERQQRSAEGELISVTINSGIRRTVDLDRHNSSSEDKSHYKRVEIGDIAYNSMRMWQGASGCSFYRGILSPAYTVAIPKEGINSEFFAYMFKKSDLIYQFRIHSQGLTSDTWNLKYPAFSKIVIRKPIIDEQKKIAIFFRSLDRLITLHQQELEKLKNLKTSLLQKMFV